MIKYKYIFSASFILSFFTFLTADIWIYPLTKLFGYSVLAVRLGQLLSLILSIILFSILFKKILYSANPLTVSRTPLISSLKNVNDPLLMIRFFAFFCVVVTHCTICFHLGPQQLDQINMPWGFLIRGCAHSGMVIFFCLSGYLMGKAFFSKRYYPDSTGIKSFYLNRALRIVPLCYFAIFICTVLSCPECPDIIKDPTVLWRPLLFLYYSNMNQFGQSPIGALWALSVEMQYYIIAPFIFILFGRFLNTKTRSYIFMLIVIALGFGLKYKLLMIHAPWYEYRYTPLYANLDFFLVGFGINGLIEQDRINIQEPAGYQKNAMCAIIICFLIYLIGSAGEYSPHLMCIIGLNNFDVYNHSYIHLLNAAILVMTLSCIYNVELYKVRRKFISEDKKGLFHRLSNKISNVLQILGLLAFGLYVWHAPILETYSKLISPYYTLSEYFLICTEGLLVVLIVSTITYYIIERPCEKYKI